MRRESVAPPVGCYSIVCHGESERVALAEDAGSLLFEVERRMKVVRDAPAQETLNTWLVLLPGGLQACVASLAG